jgi:indole-3-glycerol phosphate synthase
VNLIPDLTSLEGTLGRICRARLEDYVDANVEVPERSSQFSGGRFEAALSKPGLHLIAELKRSSPRGEINAALNAIETAQAYATGGASALSVLTEPRDFLGSLEDLREVIAHVNLPVLRKDFTVHPKMILEAADAGASAVLLLVNVLGKLTKPYLEMAHDCGLDALVEIHTEPELEIAIDAGARIIGINNRDLKTLEINTGTAPRLGQLARQDDFEGPLLALSGYSNRAELIALEGLFNAVLVGSSLAGAGDAGQIVTATKGLLGK